MRLALTAEGTFATRGIFATGGLTADSRSLAAAVREFAATAVALDGTAERGTRTDASTPALAALAAAAAAAGLVVITIASACFSHYILNAENILLNYRKIFSYNLIIYLFELLDLPNL